MSQLPPGFVLDDGPAPTGPAPVGPLYGAPAKPDKPDAPKTTYRTLTPEEAATRGLDPAGAYQVSSEGKVDVVQPPATAAKGKGPTVEALKESTRAMLLGAGINLETGEDPILPLIAGSTSGKLQTLGAEAYGAVTGDATDGMEKIGRLKTVVNDMVLALSGGSLGAQISNTDRDFMAARLGDIGNPDLPASQRAASWDQVKKRFANILGVEMPGAPDDKSAPEGKKLVAYRREQDGSLVPIYADTGGTPPDGGTPPPADGGPDGGFSLFGATPDQMWEGAKQGVSSMVGGIGDVAGIVANPLNAGINAVAGTNLSTNLGQDLPAMMGLPKNQNALADAAVRFGTGAMTGSMAARGASMLPQLPGAVRGAVNMLGKNPITDTVAGAAAGAGSQLGQQSGVPGGEIAGGLIGGLAGYGGANALARLAGPRAPNAIMQSADELGVQMMPADVGGVGTRMATGGIGRTLGGIPLAEGAQTSIATANAAKGRIAAKVGDVTDNVGAGQATKRGFDGFVKNSERRATELYDNVSVPGETKVQLGNTRGALTEVTQGMQSNPAMSRLWANHPRMRSTLEALTPKDGAPDGRRAFSEASDRLTELQLRYDQMRNAVTDPRELASTGKAIAEAKVDLQRAQREATREPVGGELSWQDMKRFRSIVGEVIGQPGVSRDGSDIAALRKLYGALSSDMEVTAAQAGPRALTEFRRASQYWRGREARIEQVFSGLLGKDGNRSDEAVFKQINTWAQKQGGDFGRLARTIRSLPDDEANTVRATLIQKMGIAKAAKQDATENAFSPAEFATQWRGMSGRAKSVLFPDKQHRQDLEKFATLMDGMKKASEFQNFSNTSLGVNVTTQGALAFANLPIAVALAGSQFAAGKLLASPGFARWLAKAPRTENPAALRKYTEQLGVLAGREAAIAGDARALQQHLQQSLGQSPTRVAAEEKPDAGRVPPK